MPALIAAPIATALGGGIVATAVANLLVGVAFSALSQAIFKPEQPKQPGITTRFPGNGDVTPQSFILGDYATAGHDIAPAYAMGGAGPDYGAIGSGQYLTIIRNLSDAPLSGMSGFFINGVRFDYANDLIDHPTLGKQLKPAGSLGQAQADYAGKLFVQFYDGTQTEVSHYLRDAYGQHPTRPWAETSVHRGGAYVIVTLRIDRDLYSGIPELLFEVSGMPLLDPRTDEIGPTNNPVVMKWNLYQTITIDQTTRYGVGYPRSALPDDQWFAAMNLCDFELVVDGTIEPQYRAGFEVRIAQPDGGGSEPLDVIDELKPTCSASLAEVAGDVFIRVGAPGLPVALITDDDFLQSEVETAQTLLGLSNLYNSIAATHPDPAQKWAAVDAPIITDEDAVSDLGEVRQASLDLNAAPYSNQVTRLMTAWLKDAQRGRVHGGFFAARWAAKLLPLSVVAWTSLAHGYDQKLFEVQKYVSDPKTGQAGIILREVDPDDYSTAAVNYTPRVPGAAPVAVIPFDIGDIEVQPVVMRDDDGVDRRAGIRVTWDTDAKIIDAVSIEVRFSGQTEAAVSVSQPDGDLGLIDVFDGILPNTSYQVRARGIVPGVSDWTTWRPVTTADVRFGSLDIEEDRAARARDLIAYLRDVTNEKEVKRVEVEGVNARNLLDAALTGRLDGADAEIVRVETEISAEVALANSRITAAEVSYAAADLALAGRIDTIEATVGGNSAAITATEVAVADLTASTASRFTTVEASVDGNAAAIVSEELARTSEDAALGGRIDTIEATVNQNSANVSLTQTALATLESAQASFEASASSSIASLNATVTIQANTLADIEGNQQASLVLRTSSGGSTGELVIVAADDPTGSPLSGIYLGADLIFVNGAIQSLNFSTSQKVGWRLKQNGDFDFFGQLTRAAFLDGVLQFPFASWAKSYGSGSHTFARSGIAVIIGVGGGGGGAANSTTDNGTAGLTAGGGAGGGCFIVALSNVVAGQSFSVAIGSGGSRGQTSGNGYDNGNNGGSTTFSSSSHGVSATAGGGQGGRNATSSAGSASGGYRNYSGLSGKSGGGRGTTRFGAEWKASSGGNHAAPLDDDIRMQAFWLDFSKFDTTEALAARYGVGGEGGVAANGAASFGGAGGDGVLIVGYFDAGDFV